MAPDNSIFDDGEHVPNRVTVLVPAETRASIDFFLAGLSAINEVVDICSSDTAIIEAKLGDNHDDVMVAMQTILDAMQIRVVSISRS